MEQPANFQIDHHLTKRILVFGSGNPLFGDDGFGERVIEQEIREGTRTQQGRGYPRCRTISGRLRYRCLVGSISQ